MKSEISLKIVFDEVTDVEDLNVFAKEFKEFMQTSKVKHIIRDTKLEVKHR